MSDDIDDEDIRSLRLAFLPELKGRISKDKLNEKIEQGILQVIEETYNSLINLEALFLDDPFFFFPFQTRINVSLVPPQFLSHLKVLYIPIWSGGEGQSLNPNLNASNVVWLLLQCSQLVETSFGLSYSMNDFKTISEASEAFNGKSTVKKLSLSIDFVQVGHNRSAVWDHYGKGTKDWKGGNQRTEALVHLLQATDQLQALEVFLSSLSSDTPQEGSSLCADFLSFLHRSFNSLKHLRLLGVDLGDTALSPRVLHPFQSMTLLTVDQPMILGFKERKQSCLLPPNLKAIYLPYYVIMHKTDTDVDFLEELWLAEFVNVIPSAPLKEVIVPLKAIDVNQKPWVKSRSQKAGWDAKRKRVENVDIFKIGKVRLRFVEPSDEFAGDASQGEVFMSCLNWLSPFL